MNNSINFYFISNLKVSPTRKINNQEIIKNKRILYKYVVLLIFFNGLQDKNKILNIKIFVKKLKLTKYTYLNAPYRYKLSKCNLGFKRYYLNLRKIYNKDFFLLKNFNQLLNIISFFFKNLPNYETNLIFLKKKKISLSIKYSNNFLIKNY